MKMSEGNTMCAFCRTPLASNHKENNKRIKKLLKNGNAEAFYTLGGYYARGLCGLTQDVSKANELHQKAGELGCANAYYNLGQAYREGIGVNIDMKKAKHYYELAAINGEVDARHNLGSMEYEAGNYHRAMKHHLIAARAGDNLSLNNVKDYFMKGLITKDEYANTLRAYQKSLDEMKSDARDKAELAPDMFR